MHMKAALLERLLGGQDTETAADAKAPETDDDHDSGPVGAD